MQTKQQGYLLLGLGKAILLAVTVVGCLSLGLGATTYTVGVVAKDIVFPQAAAAVSVNHDSTCVADH